MRKTPDITDGLHKELVASGVSPAKADELLAFAREEGISMRTDRHMKESSEVLRADLSVNGSRIGYVEAVNRGPAEKVGGIEPFGAANVAPVEPYYAPASDPPTGGPHRYEWWVNIRGATYFPGDEEDFVIHDRSQRDGAWILIGQIIDRVFGPLGEEISTLGDPPAVTGVIESMQHSHDVVAGVVGDSGDSGDGDATD